MDNQIDTVRIILTLKCNINCGYCCNKKYKFFSKFKRMFFKDIDFSKYKNVCITGGEIFMIAETLYEILRQIPKNINIYLYTNGILISGKDIVMLKQFKNIKGINIGLHSPAQINLIHQGIEQFNVRYAYELKKKNLFFINAFGRLDDTNSKGWVMDECERSNEEWIYLLDYDN